MKIYLDDLRPAPPGYILALWPEEVIARIEAGGVTHVSLDHDLSDDDHGTGYDVILWIENAVATRGLVPPNITVHSANSAARVRMEAGIRSIARLVAARIDPA